MEALAHREPLLVSVSVALALSDAKEADAEKEALTLADKMLRVPHGVADVLGQLLLLGENAALGELLEDTSADAE